MGEELCLGLSWLPSHNSIEQSWLKILPLFIFCCIACIQSQKKYPPKSTSKGNFSNAEMISHWVNSSIAIRIGKPFNQIDNRSPLLRIRFQPKDSSGVKNSNRRSYQLSGNQFGNEERVGFVHLFFTPIFIKTELWCFHVTQKKLIFSWDQTRGKTLALFNYSNQLTIRIETFYRLKQQ